MTNNRKIANSVFKEDYNMDNIKPLEESIAQDKYAEYSAREAGI